MARLNNCRFIATAGGTTDWTYASAASGYNDPITAGAVTATPYEYFAISADFSQFEGGKGNCTITGGVPTFARTTVLFNSSGTTAKINFSAAPQVAIVALKEDMLAGDETGQIFPMTNGQLVASAAGNSLTVAVKTVAGNDPSPNDPVWFYFPDNTLTSGDTVRVPVTSALSVVLGSTKTLGATSGQGLRVWIFALNNAGTVQIAAQNCSDVNGVNAPAEGNKYTTAVPGSSSKTLYSTSAIGTPAPLRYLAYCEWNSLTTAGNWVAPDIVRLFGPGMRKPGETTGNIGQIATSSFSSGTLNTYQSSPVAASITPQSSANLIRTSWSGTLYNRATLGSVSAFAALLRSSTTIGGVYEVWGQGQQAETNVGGVYYDLPNTTSSVTYTVKFKNSDNSTNCSFPADANNVGTLVLEEVMG